LKANGGIVSTSSLVLGAAAAHATHGSKLIDRVFARHGRQQARRPDGAMLQHNCATGHVTTVDGPFVKPNDGA
jgi:hypothetical protein